MKYKVTLNGKTYEIEVERGEAILVDVAEAAAPVMAAAPVAAPVAAAPVAATAPAAAPTAGGEVIASPMPGAILAVKCAAGQAVKKGDVLVVLEAMKMENDILAPRDATVAQVVTSKGSTVDTGAPLVVLS